ncbi:hypothetical protein [Leucobacter sp. GX0328]
MSGITQPQAQELTALAEQYTQQFNSDQVASSMRETPVRYLGTITVGQLITNLRDLAAAYGTGSVHTGTAAAWIAYARATLARLQGK